MRGWLLIHLSYGDLRNLGLTEWSLLVKSWFWWYKDGERKSTLGDNMHVREVPMEAWMLEFYTIVMKPCMWITIQKEKYHEIFGGGSVGYSQSEENVTGNNPSLILMATKTGGGWWWRGGGANVHRMKMRIYISSRFLCTSSDTVHFVNGRFLGVCWWWLWLCSWCLKHNLLPVAF